MSTFIYKLINIFDGLCVCFKNKKSYALLCESNVVYLCTLFLRFSSYTVDTALIDLTVFNGIFNHSFYYNFRIDSHKRLYLFTFTKDFILSIEDLYQNANWFEREASEMFNIFYKNSTDTRNLLLAYNMQYGPLCKEVSCTGLGQIHFDISLNSIYWYAI